MNGRILIVKLGDNIKLLCTSFDVNINNDVQEISHPGDNSWKRYRTTCNGWSLSSNHLFAVGDLSKIPGQTIGEKLNVKIGTSNGFDVEFDNVTGTVICTSANVTSECGSFVKGVFQFNGVGELRKTSLVGPFILGRAILGVDKLGTNTLG